MWDAVYLNEPCTGVPDNLCKLVLGGHGEMWGETVDASDIQQTASSQQQQTKNQHGQLYLLGSVGFTTPTPYWGPSARAAKQNKIDLPVTYHVPNDYFFWVPFRSGRASAPSPSACGQLRARSTFAGGGHFFLFLHRRAYCGPTFGPSRPCRAPINTCSDSSAIKQNHRSFETCFYCGLGLARSPRALNDTVSLLCSGTKVNAGSSSCVR